MKVLEEAINTGTPLEIQGNTYKIIQETAKVYLNSDNSTTKNGFSIKEKSKGDWVHVIWRETKEEIIGFLERRGYQKTEGEKKDE